MIWGVLERIHPKHSYLANLHGTPEVVCRLLEIFLTYGISATWATVGMLFAKDFDELESYIPPNLPHYTNKCLNPYARSGALKKIDPRICFAPDLIEKISETEGQEIGTHTFSHFYANEMGQSAKVFQADLCAAVQIAKKKSITISSLVFPRNQVNPDFLHILKPLGIKTYRGNEDGWMFEGGKQSHRFNSLGYFKQMTQRSARLMDSYIKINKHQSTAWNELSEKEDVLNIPGSHFLRPFSKYARLGNLFRLERIKTDMLYAASKGEIFHLWWHPHNFGSQTDENIDLLRRILDYYWELNRQYGMESMNMKEVEVWKKGLK